MSSKAGGLARQPSMDVIFAGAGGYGVCLMADEERPNLVQMENMDAAVNAYANHVLAKIVHNFQINNDRNEKVVKLVVGKSFVGEKKNSTFNSKDSSTWNFSSNGNNPKKNNGGVASRFNEYKKKKGFSALVIFECICENDVPEQLRVFGFNHYDLALKFENLILRRLRDMLKNTELNEYDFTLSIDNNDEGSGGRFGLSTGSIGQVLYVAVKLGPCEQCDYCDCESNIPACHLSACLNCDDSFCSDHIYRLVAFTYLCITCKDEFDKNNE